MKVFSVEDAREVLKMPDVIAALRVMYRELGDGRAANRVRSDTICETPSGDAYGLKSMDGLVPKLEVGSVRINSDVVTWPKRAGTIRREKVPAAPGSRWTGLILLSRLARESRLRSPLTGIFSACAWAARRRLPLI